MSVPGPSSGGRSGRSGGVTHPLEAFLTGMSLAPNATLVHHRDGSALNDRAVELLGSADRPVEGMVDGRLVADLFRVSGTGFGVAWAILAIFIALAVIVAIAGTQGDGSVGENLVDTWNSIAMWFQGLFNRGS